MSEHQLPIILALDAPPEMPLLWVLRDIVGLTGTKFGCGVAQCGACTVHVDGKPVRSCVLPVGKLQSRAITTIEGIGATPVGARLRKASLDLEVVQCGYCQSGQIMSTAALLASTSDPDESDINAASAAAVPMCVPARRHDHDHRRAVGAHEDARLDGQNSCAIGRPITTVRSIAEKSPTALLWNVALFSAA